MGSEMCIRDRSRAPELGEHTDEVLKELGFSVSEIDDLRIDRII